MAVEVERCDPPKIGIVTVTYNSRNVLEDFFASLSRQTYTSFNLYIVDSGSTDETLTYCRAYMPQISGKTVILENSKNIGFAAGTNQGIKHAMQDGCDYILALNNDTVFGPDLLQLLADGLDRYKCDMTTPMMYYYEPKDRIWAAGGRLQKWLAYRNLHRGFNETDRGQYSMPCQVTFAPLCCVLIRKEVFDKVGLLDEAYFTYTEDVDFMLQCLRRNIHLWYLPNARLWHKVSSLSGGETSETMIRYCTRNRIYFLYKNLPEMLAIFTSSLYRTYIFIRRILGIDSPHVWDIKQKNIQEGLKMLRLGKE